MELDQTNTTEIDEDKGQETGGISYRKIQSIVGDTSFSLVLPKKYAVKLGIKKGDFVKVMERKDEIVVQKV